MTNPFVPLISQILPEPQASLLLGMVYGVKSNLPFDFYQNLITTGTIHIVVLSGQNISLLAKIISEITLVWGRRVSIFLTVVGIGVFVLFVGLEPPIVRASVMAFITAFSVYFGRQNWSLLSLIFAALFMLVINPLWLFDISFQLSFLATLGIILCGGHVHKKEGWRPQLVEDIKLNLRITLSAQLFTLPVIFWHFRRISLISPVANLFISPVISPIVVLGLVLSLTALISLNIARFAGWIVWVLLTYLIFIVDLFAKVPAASISF